MASWSGSDGGAPRVAYDVTTAVGIRTGVGHAVVECYRALRRLAQAPALVPFAFGVATARARRSLPPGTRIVPLPTRALVAAWSRAEHPRLDPLVRHAQVMHATSFVAPPSRLPTLVTIHDCAFARYPETVTSAMRAFQPILRRALRRGAHVHCTTRAVAEEVEDLFGPGLLAAGRIAVVPFGVPGLGAGGDIPAALSARLGGKPYVLALARLERRKNLTRLVRAFGAIALRHPDLQLVLAGPDGGDEPSIEAAVSSLEPAVRRRVILAGPVSDAARRPLLEGAALLAYPSLYEGFGFPMLEAMEVGVPVVTSATGGLREVAGAAAAFADPSDVESIAAEIDGLLTDGDRRRQLVAKGRRRVRSFSWVSTAEGLDAVYRELSAPRGLL